MVRKVEEDEEMEGGLETWQQQTQASLQHLGKKQVIDLHQIFADLPALFQLRPGRTNVLQHMIHLKDPIPIRQRPYQKLLPRETRYSTIEKECLAIKWALDSLRYYLLRREFDLATDHLALT
ncbi:hypothetical protein SKAU_G00093960 [Synaphobranchus kaupii]|uniref:Reverse transcriptase RNase H-like domain-containing protein n=1 Tax=Synaphobranchus kaupii TaxID=118154 RepID=A0A9Q1FX30_SYNKA|nr:hypothetical protein SKAU_G00093960 [Synaphobranchus kaupii]